MNLFQHFRARRSRRRAHSLVELAVSTMLVGVLMTAALQATAQSLLSQRLTADRAIAESLAQSLLTEVLQQSYADPATSSAPLGLDSGETPSIRATYDDVDDYHAHAESSPRYKDGTSIPGLTGWTRTVAVSWVVPITLNPTAGPETGAKRITVSATSPGGVVYSVVGFRTSAP